jgi:RsiW-degrading membrane proteinase PrsW (M82 family)
VRRDRRRFTPAPPLAGAGSRTVGAPAAPPRVERARAWLGPPATPPFFDLTPFNDGRVTYNPAMVTLQYILMGFAPGLFWLWYFRRKDDLEPEPRAMLLRVFALGCVAALIVLLLRPAYEVILPTSSTAWRVLIDAFIVTALFEELAKLLAFLAGAYFHHEFDEPLDGVIYGIAAALGFASVENVVYLFLRDDPSLVVLRAFTATLGHVAFTGSIGFFFGLAKFSEGVFRQTRLMLIGLGIGVLFHGAYDVFLFMGGGPQILSLAFVLPLVLVVLGLKIRWSRSLSPIYHGPEEGDEEG